MSQESPLAKNIAPNWKVLQMKLKEEKKEEAKSEPSSSFSRKGKLQGVPQFHNKKKLKRAESAKSNDSPSKPALTRILALDCEYVGVGADGKEDALARVSIVNEDSQVVYDKYVKPAAKVVDYRTHVSGIRPSNLVNGERFEDVQKEVHGLLDGRVIVGHAIHNDFRVLSITHPRKLTRDTAKCKCLRPMLKSQPRHPSLKQLASDVLGIEIQQGEHDSIVDARVALRVYLTVKKKWEDEIRRFGPK